MNKTSRRRKFAPAKPSQHNVCSDSALADEGRVEFPDLVASRVVEIVSRTGREVHEFEPGFVGKEIDQILQMTPVQVVEVFIESTSAGLDCFASLHPHAKICEFSDHRIDHGDILLFRAPATKSRREFDMIFVVGRGA